MAMTYEVRPGANSVSRRARLAGAVGALVLVTSMAGTAWGASPGSATIGPGALARSWSGHSYLVGAVADPSLCAPAVDPEDLLCDHMIVTVDVGSAYWNTHTGGATVSIGWGSADDDFDLYVYRGDTRVASSARRGTRSEAVTIDRATGTYEVRVVPHQVTDSGYGGTARFASEEIPGDGGGGGGGGGDGGGSGGGGSGGGGSGGGGGDSGSGDSGDGSGTGSGGSTGGGSGGGGGSGSGGSGTGSGGSGGAGSSGGGGSGMGSSGGFLSGSGTIRQTYSFSYFMDRAAWYWSKQVHQPIQLDTIGTTVRLPNPQQDDTLPVAATSGSAEKVSALYFDLAGRGFRSGTTIKSMTLRIATGSDAEGPTLNADGKAIRACLASQSWQWARAEIWAAQPAANTGACVTGSPVRGGWSFDLTRLARSWGQDPVVRNHGIVLLPAAGSGGATETWQINLKIPARDDPATGSSEYAQTRNRLALTVVYVPAGFVPPPGPPGDDPTPGEDPGDDGTVDEGSDPTDEGSGTGAEEWEGGDGFLSGGIPYSPSGTFYGSTGGFLSGGELFGGFLSGTSPEQAAGQAESNRALAESEPVALRPGAVFGGETPWYVWVLIPLGLLGLAAVRLAVMEPGGGPREAVAAAWEAELSRAAVPATAPASNG